jgi:hypothetical protein
MTIMQIRTILGVFALATVLGAEPITFTINGTGTGLVDDTTITNAAFTFTLTTDTTLIGPGDAVGSLATPAVSNVGLSIAGIGDSTFNDPLDIFVVTDGSVGLTDPNQGVDLIDGRDAIFATYDLQSSLGPVSVNSELWTICRHPDEHRRRDHG